MKTLKKESDNLMIAENMLQTNRTVSQDKEVLAEIIDTDLRENLPPQMLAVINSVFKVIGELEEGALS